MHIVLLKCPHVQIAFLKFTSCDNQALIGYILIATVAVHLKLEIIKISQSSHKMYSNNILNFQDSTTILNACTKGVGKLIEFTTYTHSHANLVTMTQLLDYLYRGFFYGGEGLWRTSQICWLDWQQKNGASMCHRFRFWIQSFSFSQIGCLMKARESNLSYYITHSSVCVGIYMCTYVFQLSF